MIWTMQLFNSSTLSTLAVVNEQEESYSYRMQICGVCRKSMTEHAGS